MIAKDKVQHFVAGVLVALVGLGLSHLMRGQLRPSDGVSLALLAGVAKEVYDYIRHRKAVQWAADEKLDPPAPYDIAQSALDAVATLAGGVIVGVASSLIVGRVA